MAKTGDYSILFPEFTTVAYKKLSDTVCHDLGLDILCKQLSTDAKERNIIMNILSEMTKDPKVANYRQAVFLDILEHPSFRKKMMDLFERIEFIRNFGIKKNNTDERTTLLHLVQRLEDLNDYICCVEAMKECLEEAKLSSEGLRGLHSYICAIYEDTHFAEMKKDVEEMKVKTSQVQSVTLGINLNDRYEATSVGIVSVNNKTFKKSGIVKNFAEAVSSREKVQDGSEWSGDMHYREIDREQRDALAFMGKLAGFQGMSGTAFVDGRIRATIATIPENDALSNTTYYLENIMNRMLDTTVKHLREVLTKYASVSIINISELIPEFMYYIRFAELIDRYRAEGFTFQPASAVDASAFTMDAKELYNLKLVLNGMKAEDIVTNDLGFDAEHAVYLLTGANRGGKTTLTQAVGILFVLAQGGIFVPAKEFIFAPVDAVYTHFPADEDKTMDLGRLGEECSRFKDLYSESTSHSLLLLNETFSTTSFEEGYYIARDAIRAILKKGIRTIYNTHMHKLAMDAGEMNQEETEVKAASLIMQSEQGNRCFKVLLAPPDGQSYAKDIAEKYGVTYEKLMKE